MWEGLEGGEERRKRYNSILIKTVFFKTLEVLSIIIRGYLLPKLRESKLKVVKTVN